MSNYFKLINSRRLFTLEECFEELDQHKKQLDYLLKGKELFEKAGHIMYEATILEIDEEQEQIDYYEEEIAELKKLDTYKHAGEVFHKVYSNYH